MIHTRMPPVSTRSATSGLTSIRLRIACSRSRAASIPGCSTTLDVKNILVKAACTFWSGVAGCRMSSGIWISRCAETDANSSAGSLSRRVATISWSLASAVRSALDIDRSATARSSGAIRASRAPGSASSNRSWNAL
ncbi:hypothetical protein GCM10023196_017060 [Actinoallomurus vinaceus]|uniref:Uncharacterized protein n=1 Tax=Actinoallomurus vinaceus TaxID=1080074 RepID=A0ABP8U7A7_9ACTN